MSSNARCSEVGQLRCTARQQICNSVAAASLDTSLHRADREQTWPSTAQHIGRSGVTQADQLGQQRLRDRRRVVITVAPMQALTSQSPIAPQQRDKCRLKRDPRFASTADSSTLSTRSMRATLDSEPSAQRQTSSRERNPQNAEARASHALMPLDKVVRIIASRLSAKDILPASCIRLERASSKCSRNPTTLSTGSNSSQPRFRGISLAQPINLAARCCVAGVAPNTTQVGVHK